MGVFAQKQIPPSTASRLPIPAVAHCALAFIGARGSASQARLFTPFLKGGNVGGIEAIPALLAPFEKGGGHCNAMAGDLRL